MEDRAPQFCELWRRIHVGLNMVAAIVVRIKFETKLPLTKSKTSRRWRDVLPFYANRGRLILHACKTAKSKKKAT
jgi:hypothetical protein